MKLTKIDVAEAHIHCTVRVFFHGKHPVPVFLLTSAAREVIAIIGEKTDTLTVQAEMAAKRGIPAQRRTSRSSFGAALSRA